MVPLVRHTYGEFADRLTRLTDDEARALGEVTRLPNWRRDRDLGWIIQVVVWRQLAYVELNAANRHAVEACVAAAGRRAIDEARANAAALLERRDPSWPGSRLHRPLRVVALLGFVAGAVAGVAGVIIASAAANDAASIVMIGSWTIAALAALATYLLPPSRADLGAVVSAAAMAHAAGPWLAEEHFRQLAGGWYAVLEDGWRRGPRPYLLWGCLLVTIGLLVLLALALLASGVQLWGPGAA